jgi:hypothetical protein
MTANMDEPLIPALAKRTVRYLEVFLGKFEIRNQKFEGFGTRRTMIGAWECSGAEKAR